jgi:flagellar protein FliO/FliZ
MILEYFGRLLVVMPLIAGMVWGVLWLWKKFQLGVPMQTQKKRNVNVLESVSLGSNGRLLVVEFGREKLLVGVSRAGITLLTATEQNLPHA